MARTPNYAQRKLTGPEMAEVKAAYEKWIDETANPLAASFCLNHPIARKYNVHKGNIEDWPELELLYRRANMKQESYYVTRGLSDPKPVMSIFLLKQKNIGYTDKTETDITSNGERITFANHVPRPSLKKAKEKK